MASVVFVRLDDDGDAAVFGELDGVAGEIEQHLAQARGVADEPGRQPLVDEAGDLDALGLRARRQQFDGFLDQRQQREGARFEIELAGFDLGEVEDFLDQRQQRFARGLRGLDVSELLGRQRGVEQQVGHAEQAVERRADLVADGGEEARLGAVGGFRLVARELERLLGFDAAGDVAADAPAPRCRFRCAPPLRARRSSARRRRCRSSGRACGCRRRAPSPRPVRAPADRRSCATLPISASRRRPASAQNASLA